MKRNKVPKLQNGSELEGLFLMRRPNKRAARKVSIGRKRKRFMWNLKGESQGLLSIYSL